MHGQDIHTQLRQALDNANGQAQQMADARVRMRRSASDWEGEKMQSLNQIQS